MKSRGRSLFLFCFLFPSVLALIVFYLQPTLTIVYTSLCDWFSNAETPLFAGFKNYQYLFGPDSGFWAALAHTAVYVGLQGIVNVPFATVVALVLWKRPAGWGFVRTVFVIPNILSSAAIAMVFGRLLEPETGIVNALLRLARPDADVRWLTDPGIALFSVSLSFILFAGICTVLILTELSYIPPSILEAARIDGASEAQVIGRIVLPCLRNVIGTGLILQCSYALTMFDLVYILTKGGPGDSTANLGYLFYQTTLVNSDLGLGNAIAVLQILLGILLIWGISAVFGLGRSDSHGADL